MSEALNDQALLCATIPDRTVVYATATLQRAADEMRGAMDALRDSGAEHMVSGVYLAHGRNHIRFTNGSRVIALSPHVRGAGRGYAADCVVLEDVRNEAFEDEAWIMTQSGRRGYIIRVGNER